MDPSTSLTNTNHDPKRRNSIPPQNASDCKRQKLPDDANITLDDGLTSMSLEKMEEDPAADLNATLPLGSNDRHLNIEQVKWPSSNVTQGSSTCERIAPDVPLNCADYIPPKPLEQIGAGTQLGCGIRAQIPEQGVTVPKENVPLILETIQEFHRHLPKFRVVEYYKKFRFKNVDHLPSFQEVLEAVHWSVQSLLDNSMDDIGSQDRVQLRMEGDSLTKSINSFTKNKEEVDAEKFLSHVASVLQSNSNCLGSSSLTLTITIVRNRVGSGKKRRTLKSICFSQIIEKKKRWLFDFSPNKLCFAASLIALLNQRLTDQEHLSKAKVLHEELGLSEDHMVSFSDVAKFETHLNVTIHVLYYDQEQMQFFEGEKPYKDKILYILHHNEHYYGINNIKGFLGANYFCDGCLSVFHHRNDHSCKDFCKACLKRDCCKTGEIRCPTCRLFCRSEECLDNHKTKAQEGIVECKLKELCEECHQYYKADSKHKCQGLKCRVCGGTVEKFEDHLCYMSRYKAQTENDNYIVYDIECTQDTQKHIPNYIYATTLDGTKFWEFQSIDQFVKHFIDSRFKKYTFIAHNAGKYDSYFVLRQLIREKHKIKLIAQGGKLLCVDVVPLKIRFIDSINFLPMKLSKLPQALGFTEVKGFFPHFFNTSDNQNYVGSLPPIETYGVDSMMPQEKEEFLKWYNEQRDKEEVFDFQVQLKKYCKQDVEILRQACVCFRKRVMEMTKNEKDYTVDPFQLTTLASLCMAMYTFKFLPEKTIAILPNDRYHKTKKRFSTPAIQWLMYISHKEQINIQHALRGGEKKVGRYFLDGYAKVNGVHTAFEFLGCIYHGCPICFNKDDTNVVTKSPNAELYDKYERKNCYLEQCKYNVRALWEHEWQQMVKSDQELQAYLSQMQLPQPLEPRDALYGGRTNAIKLYHKVAPGETISYYDFTSLYPFVNKTKVYPIDHPDIIYKDFKDITEYFGIAKVKVYPPKELFFPVLPMRANGKLMFPLCRTCAINLARTKCDHSDEERAITGTWCTIEIQVAVEKGYRIAKIYEIWHFPKTSDSLFAEYIELHLRDKQEASGYPGWCTDEEKKKQYIEDYKEREGISLRPDQIGVNPAKRQISKLFLNSLWGKFGQRPNLTNTSIVTKTDEFFKYFFSSSYDVSSLDFIDEETAMVSWKYSKESHAKVNRNTNIFIACFTTAYARLELFKILDSLQERCLYHDTDSVIFVSKEGDYMPPLGDYLGDLTSEIPDDTHITEFVSAGPKTYGCKLSNGETTMKVKGITLNCTATKDINFDSLKELVLDYSTNPSSDSPKKIVVEQPGIVRRKKCWEIETRQLRKTQKCVYTKRHLTQDQDYTTQPFGY